jgi:murein DD-endopeptidase MepM/ murein hydrolase activator NlpD
MSADGEAESRSAIDGAVPDPAWARLRAAWNHAREAGILSRLVLHGCFLFMLLGPLLVGRSSLNPVDSLRSLSFTRVLRSVTATARAWLGGSEEVVTAEPRMAVVSTNSSIYFLRNAPGLDTSSGTGGEVADVLLSAVVPHTKIPRRYRIDPITYTVQSGDNVSSIAAKFGVSADTVLWNNGNLEDNPDYLSLGDVLTILPVSGVYHTVVKDDTLESIAKQYEAEVAAIMGYEGNYLQEPYTITVGQKLIVPGGERPYMTRHVVAWSGTVPKDAKRGSGSFGWPISGYITQRYSDLHQAADIGAPEGTPVRAADSGYVALVGRNDTGYGRYILIDHGNGFQTLYAHLSVIYVEIGQSVSKGQMIARSGNTGKSTGPHLHFEIKLNGVRRNPFIYLK